MHADALGRQVGPATGRGNFRLAQRPCDPVDLDLATERPCHGGLIPLRTRQQHHAIVAIGQCGGKAGGPGKSRCKHAFGAVIRDRREGSGERLRREAPGPRQSFGVDSPCQTAISHRCILSDAGGHVVRTCYGEHGRLPHCERGTLRLRRIKPTFVLRHGDHQAAVERHQCLDIAERAVKIARERALCPVLECRLRGLGHCKRV